MNREEFTRLRDGHYRAIADINDKKGHDYAGDDDALANLKKDDERLRKIVLNNPAFAKWYVYFDKHLEAIMTFLEEGDVKSEPIEGRFHDAILYLFLGLGLIEEQKAEDARTSEAAEARPPAQVRPLEPPYPAHHAR